MNQKQRWQIFWLAAIGIGGTAFAFGIQLCLAIISGYGWWKAGMAGFSFLCVMFVLWKQLRQAMVENIHDA